MSKFTIRLTFTGIEELESLVDTLKDELVTEQLLTNTLDTLSESIKLRTLMGFDKNLAPFFPYSDDYAERKGSSHVNLWLSGSMLSNMDTLLLSDRSGQVYFPDPLMEERMTFHNYGFGWVPQREFFAPSVDDVDKLQEMVLENLDRILANA